MRHSAEVVVPPRGREMRDFQFLRLAERESFFIPSSLQNCTTRIQEIRKQAAELEVSMGRYFVARKVCGGIRVCLQGRAPELLQALPLPAAQGSGDSHSPGGCLEGCAAGSSQAGGRRLACQPSTWS